jgi:C-terminal processing protease CtpA/Prc
VIEGRGVIPDSAVPLRRSDLLLGRDSQLEAAIQYLEKK